MNHLTAAERSQLLWISGHSTEDAEALAEAEGEIEGLEQEVEELESQVQLLQQWKDGEKAAELDALTAEHETLSAKHEQCKQQLRSVMAALTGDPCKTVAGRRKLAAELQHFMWGQ